MGGIVSGEDVNDFVSAGASSVALGTVLFVDPWAPARIRSELDHQGTLGDKRQPIGHQSAPSSAV
jgi:dihydroorotate dehydrogenase